jgi:hypothetical protein
MNKETDKELDKETDKELDGHSKEEAPGPNVFFWLKRVLDQGPEHRESRMTVLCLLIIIILIS